MATAKKIVTQERIVGTQEREVVELVLSKAEAVTLRTLIYRHVTGHGSYSRRKHLEAINRELARAGAEVKRGVSFGQVGFKDEKGFDDE